MEENKIRYVVEQRCKKPEHRVKLGAIPVYSKSPRELEQLLIAGVDKCGDCTFHSKFYSPEQCTLLEPVIAKKEESNNRALASAFFIILLIGFVGILGAYNIDPDSIFTKTFAAFSAMVGAGLSATIAILERKASIYTKIAAGIAFLVPSFMLWNLT
ncbi:hypothetical protein M5225_004331 [Vibrio vulnificus]|uniref:hypothetical protein n=1 Tax=Vibrio TaxID=662 RepID=UPI00148D264D|nr:hypothetical protein [Vibrio jasicida]EHZ2903621.1 hypothetical protein [Vibrio vulnificus]EIA1338523.1 hypothetical protein [Vibrio vulnificus]EIA1774523.1 hypothetical protein [Vibrio vulnificus]EIU7597565.1 hypothetical protein [Vibrio vulnificus]EIX4871417.1 hypothetical protein [Vibrio vulnificus]